MPSVLFVCTGNICRSPFAERYLAHLVARSGLTDWRVESAGIGALVGRPMDAGMRAELEARGGSADGFVARQVDFRMPTRFDVVVTMERRHRQWVLEDHPALHRRVVTLGQLADAVAQAGPETSTGDLVGLARVRRSPRAEEDIADPYRQGAAATHACARRIAGLLDTIAVRVLAP